MTYQKHRHFYKLFRKHHHPNGYLFMCSRCVQENLYPFKFIRFNVFWGV